MKDLVGESFLDNATLDSIFEDGQRYRPDLCYSVAIFGMFVMFLFEFDEVMHNDRTVESEQRKVIKELICCAENNIQYVHLIRVNGGSRRIPNLLQVKATAAILHDELYGNGRAFSEDIAEKLGESGREMYVRVTLLDFEEHHHHVNAYKDRRIPTGVEVKEADSDDNWDTLLIYDEVVAKMSGAPLY